MMGKDKEPLGSEKGRELNAEVARICLALHRARPFTHLAATAQQWTEEDENPPRVTMAHLLSGACLGNREQARWFLRVARAQTGTAISKVAQAAPDSKDTLKTLRIAHVAALKGSRYRVLDEDGYDALAPAVGGVLPALADDLSEKSRRDLGAGVTRNLQVVAEAATGAVQRWIQLNDEATARIMKREEHIEWLRKLFAGERFSCWAGFRVVLTRKGIDAMYKAYNKRRKKRTDISDDEAEASADESRADPGTGESEQTASAAEGTADDGEAEQTRRARRGREQDVAEISRRMYDEIRSSRDPRDHEMGKKEQKSW
ncbi:hypothetical protein EMIHUDRAFT_210882 [Emiliania huxleyi CCMP1516]|uniref:Uncharacterized protein n=2 Tax=Emiliania huxleyi TaxID=2903 RepID=A0A0D3IXF9_EMIH1|nr:hypothetical protein EMIHUDRAFT_210882 [Emiliania huxleyi CCMP1516]EOD15944.1 hypothetical protein EMIHUDRAFT_210882 [Emiliania huxleyi CCMP1516]|eukprot:XP_005768373.1 hypothetical protein EMIHUDRAFT_210882 [Emiliania huxleyi CCMP1516]